VKQYQFNRATAISTALISLFIRTRSNRFVKRGELLSCAIAGLLLAATASGAIDVTWTGSINGNWSNGGNWDAGEPFAGDSVVFPNTSQPNVRADFSSYPETDPQAVDQPALHLQSLTFNAAAPAYSIELYASADTSQLYQARLELDGAGITNQSGVTQNFVIDHGASRGIANGDDIGVDGGRLSFNNSASAGSNSAYHALGGVTTFHTNPAGVYLFLRTSGGSVVFNNSASAGSAMFVTDGGVGNAGPSAVVEFHNNATAANGIFTNNAGAPGGNAPGHGPSPVCGIGGQTTFYDAASAGAATFTNIGQSAPYSGGSGGVTNFRDNSTAASAIFHNLGATADGFGVGVGGVAEFFGHSTAATATLSNEPSPIFDGGGSTYFGDDATAGNALIDNVGGSSSTAPGVTAFYARSTAANAVINNRGLTGGGAGAQATSTSFHDDSTAGSSTIHNFSGPDTGGNTEFYERSTAGSAHIILEPSNAGGMIVFKNDSSAGSAYLDASADNTTGTIVFKNQSTAANAVISLGANSGYSLRAQFYDTASAGNATITADGMSGVQFYNGSTAANSNITVHGDANVFFSGNFQGGPINSDGSAAIHILGGSSNSSSGGAAYFGSNATASSASLTVEGAGANGAGAGNVYFGNLADVCSATVLLKSSPVPGNPGGAANFNGALGPLARVTTEAGSLLNVAGTAGTSIGFIDGAGDINLNTSKLTVGGLGQNSTISGPITGVGGSLVKTGTGALTLTAANTYTGLTTVEQGTLIVNGSIVGNPDVKSGATLKGTGSMGTPTVETGGVFAPGTSPGTITVAGLNLLSGSTLQYELGASRDHIVVTNSGGVVLGGMLDLSILSGFDPSLGDTFPLFEGSIGSITGAFSAVNAPIFNGHALSLVYGTNQVTLVVGKAGDFNGDGAVNAADYVVWRRGLGTSYTQDDYNAWRMHFGQTTGSGSGAGAASLDAAVPEPSSLGLLFAFSIIGLIFRVRAF
jgi:autotransporter-associated beta strand protein